MFWLMDLMDTIDTQETRVNNVTYQFDPTGRSPDNLVQNEMHVVTDVNSAPYRILIPTFAPFYSNNLKVEHIDQLGVVSELHEGVDYYLALPYMDASRSTGKSVYGGIPIINQYADGAIRLTYQTVGGPWCADIAYVYARLLEHIFNPRTTWWDTLTNVQDKFPPLPHDHTVDDLYQVDILFQRLIDIRDAILQAPQNVPGAYIAHMLDDAKHPTTPEAFGFGPAAKLDLATDQEVLNRSMVDKVITLRQVLLLLNSL